MLTHKDIYTKFLIEYDKANVTSSYPSLTEYEIATILDRAYMALIALKVTGNNPRRVPFEGDVKVSEDLRPLVVNTSLTLINNSVPGVTNAVKASLPTDLLYYVSSTINTSKSSKLLNLIVKLVGHSIAQRFYSTASNHPWVKVPVAYFENDCIIVVYDPFKYITLAQSAKTENSWTINSCDLVYIKSPHKFAVDPQLNGSSGNGSSDDKIDDPIIEFEEVDTDDPNVKHIYGFVKKKIDDTEDVYETIDYLIFSKDSSYITISQPQGQAYAVVTIESKSPSNTEIPQFLDYVAAHDDTITGTYKVLFKYTPPEDDTDKGTVDIKISDAQADPNIKIITGTVVKNNKVVDYLKFRYPSSDYINVVETTDYSYSHEYYIFIKKDATGQVFNINYVAENDSSITGVYPYYPIYTPKIGVNISQLEDTLNVNIKQIRGLVTKDGVSDSYLLFSLANEQEGLSITQGEQVYATLYINEPIPSDKDTEVVLNYKAANNDEVSGTHTISIRYTPTTANMYEIGDIIYRIDEDRNIGSFSTTVTNNGTITWQLLNGSEYVTLNSDTGSFTILNVDDLEHEITVRAVCNEDSSVYKDKTITVSYHNAEEDTEVLFSVAPIGVDGEGRLLPWDVRSGRDPNYCGFQGILYEITGKNTGDIQVKKPNRASFTDSDRIVEDKFVITDIGNGYGTTITNSGGICIIPANDPSQEYKYTRSVSIDEILLVSSENGYSSRVVKIPASGATVVNNITKYPYSFYDADYDGELGVFFYDYKNSTTVRGTQYPRVIPIEEYIQLSDSSVSNIETEQLETSLMYQMTTSLVKNTTNLYKVIPLILSSDNSSYNVNKGMIIYLLEYPSLSRIYYETRHTMPSEINDTYNGISSNVYFYINYSNSIIPTTTKTIEATAITYPASMENNIVLPDEHGEPVTVMWGDLEYKRVAWNFTSQVTININ